MVGLVVAGLVETYGEGLHPRALGPHQPDDGRGIDPARQHGPQGNIGDHPGGHRAMQQRVQRLYRLVLVAFERPRLGRRHRLADIPVVSGRRHVARPGLGPETDLAAGRQLGDSLPDRAGMRHEAVTHETGQGLLVDIGGKAADHTQRLQFRTEGQRPADPAVVERLFTEPVTGQVQPARLAVPQGDGELAFEPLQAAVQAPVLDGRQQHLGVRMAAPGRRRLLGLERIADIEVVEDLAVEDDHIATTRRGHGLQPVVGRIDDRQPAMSEGDPRLGVVPQALTVRAAMQDGGAHGLDRAGLGQIRLGRRE